MKRAERVERLERTLHLLLIDDAAQGAGRLADRLGSRGFRVTRSLVDDAVLETLRRTQPDAIVLDLAAPLSEALALCRTIRACCALPVLVVGSAGGAGEELAAFAAGADDLVANGTDPRLMLARLRARVQRLRQNGLHPDRVALPRITVDAGRRAARVGGRWIDLTTSEFEVLWLLARRAGRPVSRAELCSGVRGFAYDGLDRLVDLRVARLRRRLGDDPRHPWLIKSVRGVGYLLVNGE